MHDSWLIAISLAVSALGITLLLFALIVLEPPLSTIDSLKAAPDGEPARLRGTIRGVQERSGFTIITLEQPTTIDVMVDGNVSGELSRGACVIVQGKRSSYKGTLQLGASKVTACTG